MAAEASTASTGRHAPSAGAPAGAGGLRASGLLEVGTAWGYMRRVCGGEVRGPQAASTCVDEEVETASVLSDVHSDVLSSALTCDAPAEAGAWDAAW